MEVILLEQVKKLGKIGDVVTVKGGYGRNYLIPNNKALRSTKANLAHFESQKVDIESKNDELTKSASALAKLIDGAVVPLIQQAGEDGRLYGSVNATAISAVVNEKTKGTVDRKQIVLHNPIKYIGIHAVEVDLHAEVTATIHVNIARTEGDADQAAKRFSKGDSVMEGPAGATSYEAEAEDDNTADEQPAKDSSEENNADEAAA